MLHCLAQDMIADSLKKLATHMVIQTTLNAMEDVLPDKVDPELQKKHIEAPYQRNT